MEKKLNIIGLNQEQNEQANQNLEEKDPCFGENFAKTADECKACRMPVEVNGQVLLLREVCEARSKGEEDPANFNRLSSSEVRDRLLDGKSVREIWLEILDGSSAEAYGVEARSLLYNRLYYLENEYNLDVPDLPRTQELMENG